MKYKTTEEMLSDLVKWDCDLRGAEGEGFELHSPTGAITPLENEDYPSAVMEAWTLMNPE